MVKTHHVPIFLLSILVSANSGAALPIELTGCWQSSGGETVNLEIWGSASDNLMLGYSETRRDGRSVFFEYLRIENIEGQAVLHAIPSGQPPASFELSKHDGSEWIFTNPDHDFPQSIIYSVPAPGEMSARIEGTVDGESRTVPFDKHQIDCKSVFGNPPSLADGSNKG